MSDEFCADTNQNHHKNPNTVKMSQDALALREKRNKDIRSAFKELKNERDEQNQQKWSFTQIYLILSDRFYLLPRQIQRIITGK